MDNRTVDIADRPLQDLTLGDILPYFKRVISDEIKNYYENIPVKYSGVSEEISSKILSDPTRFTFGLDGMADVLHCTVRTAMRYKKTGNYDEAIFRVGHRYVIDRVKVLEIAQQLGQVAVKSGERMM
jgi:hypothetical protein